MAESGNEKPESSVATPAPPPPQTQELSQLLKLKEPEDAETSSSVKQDRDVNPLPKDPPLDQVPTIGNTKDSVDRDAVLARVESEKRLALIKAWEENEKTKVENKAYKLQSAVELWEESKKASMEAKLKEIQMSNYSSVEGALYCKTHAEQLFKENGSITKKPQSGNPPSQLPRAPSKLSAFFSGTQEKCSSCKKTVYPLEKLTVEGEFYHKSCFRCTHGGCFLSPSSYAALDGYIYCKPHFSQLFKAKGSYSYLSKTASMKKNNEMQEGAEKSESASDTEASKDAGQDTTITQEV